MDQRRFQRVPFREALGIETDRFEEFQGLTAHDLSSGGIRIRSEQFLGLGSPIRVQFSLDNEKVVTVTGKVVWVIKEPHGEHYQLGVEFQNPAGDFSRKRIEDYIQNEY